MKKDHWWVPLAGVAFVLLVIASFTVAGEPPGADKPAQEIADFYRDNETSVMIGAMLSTIAGAVFIFFAGVLRRELRRAEGEGGTLSLIAFAGAVILAMGAAIDATILFALAEASDKIEPAQIQTLQALWDNDFIPIAMGAGIFVLASGLSIVRHGALAAWVGWLAIVTGVVMLTPVGFVAFPVAAIWVLIVSVMLALRGRSSAASQTPSPAPVASQGV